LDRRGFYHGKIFIGWGLSQGGPFRFDASGLGMVCWRDVAA